MRTIAIAAVAAASLLGAAPAVAQAQQDFAIVNRTGYQIDEVYVSSARANSWGRDLLGRNVLVHGQVFNVRFPQQTRECVWDIRVVYNDGDRSEFRGVDLCRVSRVNLFWDRSRNQTRFTTE